VGIGCIDLIVPKGAKKAKPRGRKEYGLGSTGQLPFKDPKRKGKERGGGKVKHLRKELSGGDQQGIPVTHVPV